jgi:hypothetical protein
MKKMLLGGFLGALLMLGGVSLAQKPEMDIGRHHPNLAAAQSLARQAWDKIVEAQKANEWDMNGHAQKAKELLVQVNEELKLAAETANRK